MRLSEVEVGQPCRIVGFMANLESGALSKEETTLVKRLEALGFIPETVVEVVHEAPLSHDPIAVLARGGTFALRRREAQLIKVEKV